MGKKTKAVKKKDAVNAIQDGMVAEGSVELTKEQNVPNEDVRDEYKVVEQKLRQIIATNEKAKNKYGSSLVDMKAYKRKIRELK